MKLKEYLNKYQITAVDFAAKMGISYPKICNALKGRSPTLRTAVLIDIFTKGEVRPIDLLSEKHKID